MPLGFEPGVAQAQLAMSERYGDRLVNSLAQAGQMIEVGLKTVTTMKELSSLGQQMSQLSPESPDYQQQLIGLGARHPFAMQTPQAQQMMQAQNQQHLQWKNQQHAIAMSERQDARADARLAMSEKNQLRRDANQMAIAKLRYGADESPLAPVTRVPETVTKSVYSEPIGLGQTQLNKTPTSSLEPQSIGIGYGQQQLEQAVPEMASMTPEEIQVPRTLSRAQKIANTIADIEGGSGITTNAKQRQAIAASMIGADGRAAMQEDRQEDMAVRAKMAAQAKADAFDRTHATLEEAQVGLTSIGGGKYEREDGEIVRLDKMASGGWRQKLVTTPPEKQISDIQKRRLNKLEDDIDGFTREARKIRASMKGTTPKKSKELEAAAIEQENKAKALTEEYDALIVELGDGSKDDTVYPDEAAALKAGRKKGDQILVINPRTGKPARAILE